jgi:signal-transduction protein with cAMP-binding, CBS, and nucleotidyltransferase domain
MATELSKIGTAPAVLCPAGAPITQAARAMKEHSIGFVVLVDDDHRLAGVVTDRDIVLRGVAHDVAMDAPVSQIASHEVVSVLDTASTLDAARQMAVHNCRRLPIVDAHGAVIGVVSIDDIYRKEGEVLEQIDRLLDAEQADRTVRRRY